MVLTHQLFCVKDLSSKGKSMRCANSGIPRATRTLEATVFFLPLAKRFGEGPSPPPPRAHYVSIPLFFAPDVSTTLQVSDACELHNNLPLCVGPKTTRRNLFGTARSAREGFFSPSLIELKYLSLHKF